MTEISYDAANIQPVKRNILSMISAIYDPVGYKKVMSIDVIIYIVRTTQQIIFCMGFLSQYQLHVVRVFI